MWRQCALLLYNDYYNLGLQTYSSRSSQNRRIGMMKQVLEGKGIMYNAHYGVNAIAPTQPVDERRLTEPAPAEEGGGIHL